jgi:hypothetical protein
VVSFGESLSIIQIGVTPKVSKVSLCLDLMSRIQDLSIHHTNSQNHNIAYYEAFKLEIYKTCCIRRTCYDLRQGLCLSFQKNLPQLKTISLAIPITLEEPTPT